MRTILLALVVSGCSVSPAAPNKQACLDACDVQRIACETPLHNACAHCCEPQPYVGETQSGQLFTKPIEACSTSDLPATWSVGWCMTDCEGAGDDSCTPASDACQAGCQ